MLYFFVSSSQILIFLLPKTSLIFGNAWCIFSSLGPGETQNFSFGSQAEKVWEALAYRVVRVWVVNFFPPNFPGFSPSFKVQWIKQFLKTNLPDHFCMWLWPLIKQKCWYWKWNVVMLTNSAVFPIETSSSAVTVVAIRTVPHTHPWVLARVVATGIHCKQEQQSCFVRTNWHFNVALVTK